MECPGKSFKLGNGPSEIVASNPLQEDSIYSEGGDAMIMLNQ
jgi:hypothetical protein